MAVPAASAGGCGVVWELGSLPGGGWWSLMNVLMTEADALWCLAGIAELKISYLHT